MAVDWRMGLPTDVGAQFREGFDTARRNALLERQVEMQQQDRKQEQGAQIDAQHRAAVEARREDIVRGAQLMQNVSDDAGYQQALGLARQMGIDLTDVPPNYDPRYVEGLRRVAQAFGPQRQQEGFTLSPGQARYGPDGRLIAQGAPERPRYYSVPQGGRLELDPSYQGRVQDAPTEGMTAVNPTTGERIRLNPQTNQWEPIGGPQASPSAGGFPW